MIAPLVVLPFIGGLVAYCLGKKSAQSARAVALTVAVIELLLSLGLMSRYISGGEVIYQYFEFWIRSFFVKLTFYVDGLSSAMVVLTGIIFVVATYSAWNRINYREPAFYALLLFIESGLMGVFTSADLIVFYIFWEIVLIPAFFLIGIFGGEKKSYAALKLFIYTHLGSLFMLIGFLMLFFETGGLTFNIFDLGKMSPAVSEQLRSIIFLLIFIGFAFKMPLVPFHSWLPDAYTQAPYPVSMVLSALLSKMGAYGLIRLGITLMPVEFARYSGAIGLMALITVFYAALTALAQSDIKRLVAYSSLSHMGFIALGIASLSLVGMSGAVFQMFSHGLIIALLFFLVGMLRRATGTSAISKLKGITSKHPFIGWFTVFASMASLGLPGLSGFVGEVNIIMGVFESFSSLAYIAILSLPITAAYYLWTLQRSYFGLANQEVERAKFVVKSEEAFAVVILALIIAALGIYPAMLMNTLKPAVQTLIAIAGGA